MRAGQGEDSGRVEGEKELPFPAVKEEFLYLCAKLQELGAVSSFDKVNRLTPGRSACLRFVI